MIVVILCILKAVGAFVPLDPLHPQERLDFMISDSDIKMIVTNDGFAELLSNYDGELIRLDSDKHLFENESIKNPMPINTRQNLAYIIYTSDRKSTRLNSSHVAI